MKEQPRTDSPAISVVMPLYNKEAVIKRSIESVLSQTFNNFELIIVNDGSTDNSIAEVLELSDPRIRLYNQENGGPSKARNKGVELSRADWIVFLDADDELTPEALSLFHKSMTDYPSKDMFLGEVYMRRGDRTTLCSKYSNAEVIDIFKAHVLDLLTPCSGTLMYRKSIILNDPFNENIRRYEDLERLFRLFKKYTMILIPHPVAIVNCDYFEASKGRKDISEDFLGYIDINGKRFWEKMAHYKLFFQEHLHYEEQCKKLYPELYRRKGLYFICMAISLCTRHPLLLRVLLCLTGNPIKQKKR